MNLRAPQETRYRLTPPLIYRSRSKHARLPPSLWVIIFFLNKISPHPLSLFLFIAIAAASRSARRALTRTRLCLRRDGTRRGCCAPGRRRAAAGWGRTAPLIPPRHAKRCYRFSTVAVTFIFFSAGLSFDPSQDSRWSELRLLFSRVAATVGRPASQHEE